LKTEGVFMSSITWGQHVFVQVYPVIQDLASNHFETIKDDHAQPINCDQPIPGLDDIVITSQAIEDCILSHLTPSFFWANLYENNSLMGRVSDFLFSLCE
jgi:hypothetical protein